MLVYRVESEIGQGPFASSGGLPLISEIVDRLIDLDMIESRDVSPSRHPVPYDDSVLQWNCNKLGLSHNSDNVRFGFESAQAFLAWFDCETIREEMHNVGYMLSVYDCYGKVALGEMQLVFEHKRANLVKRFQLNKAENNV